MVPQGPGPVLKKQGSRESNLTASSCLRMSKSSTMEFYPIVLTDNSLPTTSLSSPTLYRNNLKNRFLPSPHPKDDASLGTPGSAWQQIFGFHSRLAIRQWSLAPSQKFAPPPCHNPDSSDHFGIEIFLILID